jgi:hypothetical protein
LVQLLTAVQSGEVRNAEIEALIPLLISQCTLTTPLLVEALSAIANAGVCHQANAAATCSALCDGLAMQCRPCVSDGMCLTVLQQVCGTQITAQNCK